MEQNQDEYNFKKSRKYLTLIFCLLNITMGFPSGSVVKNLPANAGDGQLIPGQRRLLGGGNGNPLQYSCLQYPMDRGAKSKELD